MRAGLAAALWLFAVPSAAQPNLGAKVLDFRLFDHEGGSRELYRLAGYKAVVIFVHGVGCPMVQKRAPALRELAREFGPKGVAFLMLNASVQDDRNRVAEDAARFDYGMPILLDRAQLAAQALGITRTAEAVVIRPGSWRIVYRGAVDDRFDYGYQRPGPARQPLRRALEDVLAGRRVALAETEAKGCLLHFPERPVPTFDRIGPLLTAKCGACHHAGGAEPAALHDYDQARAWGPMIREVVMTGRMPPWSRDPEFGEFSNDFTLTHDEVRAVADWVAAGHPRGDGPPPAPASPPLPPPGAFVFELDAPRRVEASGPDRFEYAQLGPATTRELWIGAIRWEGNLNVRKHVQLYVSSRPLSALGAGRAVKKALQEFEGSSFVMSGRVPLTFPKGHALRVPAGSYLIVELHYSPSGRPEVDQTRGYLSPYSGASPPKPLRLVHASTRSIRIPSASRGTAVNLVHRFAAPVDLVLLHHHVHLRGVGVRFRARFPDGAEETLLSAPYGAVNGRMYELARPKRLPAGTVVTATAFYDNSDENPANPDPRRIVAWGLNRETDEMFKITLMYSDAD